MPAEIVSALLEPPGLYGKLPARGDFISRRLDRLTIEAWDAWLQQGILASRETLGEHWLEIYLTSPIWRFALAADCCGPNTVIGIVLPSVDKVGRYFPLMLGRELKAGLELTSLIAQAASWYRALEQLGLAALEQEFNFEALEQPIPLDIGGAPDAPEAQEALTPPGIYLPLGADPRVAALRQAHQPLARGRSLWWTSGSERVQPCLLICEGLLPPLAFASLLDGDWQRSGWHDPLVEVAPPAAAAPLEDREAPIEVAEVSTPNAIDAILGVGSGGSAPSPGDEGDAPKEEAAAGEPSREKPVEDH